MSKTNWLRCNALPLRLENERKYLKRKKKREKPIQAYSVLHILSAFQSLSKHNTESKPYNSVLHILLAFQSLSTHNTESKPYNGERLKAVTTYPKNKLVMSCSREF